MSFIRMENLSKRYGQGANEVTAVHDISLDISRGQFVAVMGESGSGKSTLLSMMGALTMPSRGEYTVDEINVYRLNVDKRAEFRREFLGFVFQSFHLIPYLTAIENVMLPLTTAPLASRQKRDMARNALERVGLQGKEGRLPNQMSGGEQERLAIARAVVNEPPILLADEPTGNLDSKTSRGIMDLFRMLNQEGMTIVMVTHSPECARNATRIVTVADGRLTGSADAVEPPLAAFTAPVSLALRGAAA